MNVDFQGFYERHNLESLKEPEINFLIKNNKINQNKISDDYHSFGELYEFRKLYNALLFNEWAAQGKYNVHKSMRHHNGELCFGGGWFIVVAELPDGPISNHYKLENWDLFDVTALHTSCTPYDGHTAADVINRMRKLFNK
jgi:hypothetical protein